MDFLEQYVIENETVMMHLNTKQKRVLAIMCLERQFKAYEKMAKKQIWNRSNEYRQLLDICWKVILYDKDVDESIWDMHEKIKPENVASSEECKNQGFSFANIFAGNIMELLENLLDDNGNEETFRLLSIDYILCFLNEDNQVFLIDEYKDNDLIRYEIKMQKQDEEDLKKICSFDNAQKWYMQCESLI